MIRWEANHPNPGSSSRSQAWDIVCGTKREESRGNRKEIKLLESAGQQGELAMASDEGRTAQ
ncbi:MAG: hypothetical protein AAB466_03995 [Verrucomicrobiota bacterium]